MNPESHPSETKTPEGVCDFREDECSMQIMLVKN